MESLAGPAVLDASHQDGCIRYELKNASNWLDLRCWIYSNRTWIKQHSFVRPNVHTLYFESGMGFQLFSCMNWIVLTVSSLVEWSDMIYYIFLVALGNV